MKTWQMLTACCTLCAVLLSGCGCMADPMKEDGSYGSGMTDENGDGIIGNDAGSADDGIFDAGTVTDDTTTDTRDIGRAAENKDIGDVVNGDSARADDVRGGTQDRMTENNRPNDPKSK